MRVGSTIRRWHGGGVVTIAYGRIDFASSRFMRGLTQLERVEHTKADIVMYKARLLPPWVNTSVIIEGVDETVVAVSWAFHRNRWRRLLGAAGFILEERTTWISTGSRLTPKRTRWRKRPETED